MISNLGEIDSEIEYYIYQKKKITHLIIKLDLISYNIWELLRLQEYIKKI